MAWQKVVGKRGNPSNVFSDNGSNFAGAQKELSSWLMRLRKCALQDRLSPPGTEKHINPSYSSHRGVFWERLIRSVRKILTALCGQQVPDDETLSIFLVEAERILNNRPLVPVTSDDLQGLALAPRQPPCKRPHLHLATPLSISSLGQTTNSLNLVPGQLASPTRRATRPPTKLSPNLPPISSLSHLLDMPPRLPIVQIY
ncbi:unnamed protein product [Echinostoma caproni]|uniref:Integrase catalytic domain-containing protein n=1 Tax=Echinostoma caproni TaxID=27848 RepID=A0A183A2U2_9TREM|nr:unnamed protein product [Echinostoma caproni]